MGEDRLRQHEVKLNFGRQGRQVEVIDREELGFLLLQRISFQLNASAGFEKRLFLFNAEITPLAEISNEVHPAPKRTASYVQKIVIRPQTPLGQEIKLKLADFVPHPPDAFAVPVFGCGGWP